MSDAVARPCCRCGQDRWRSFGCVPAEDLKDVVGPVREQLPVLWRRAEERADDRDWVFAGDVGDHFAAPAGGVAINEFGYDIDDRRAQAPGGSGCEGLRHQSA